jgi:putative ABC transport system ATP-binding protein
LQDVNLTLAQGEFVALAGPSGCGKSTLLNILGLLDKPSSGSYRLFDRELVGATESELASVRRGNIGFVFQGFNLLRELTALENVELPLLSTTLTLRARRDRARELLEIVGLIDMEARLPAHLSGGQQQRAAIARALVIEPHLLLADEPTGDLDAESEREVLDLLQTLHGMGTTIVIATHSEAEMPFASRQLRMEGGRVVA